MRTPPNKQLGEKRKINHCICRDSVTRALEIDPREVSTLSFCKLQPVNYAIHHFFSLWRDTFPKYPTSHPVRWSGYPVLAAPLFWGDRSFSEGHKWEFWKHQPFTSLYAVPRIHSFSASKADLTHVWPAVLAFVLIYIYWCITPRLILL